MTITIAVVVGLVAFYAGWLHAHRVVAKECERLGGFYVGKKVFKCVGIGANDKPKGPENVTVRVGGYQPICSGEPTQPPPRKP